ncbi:MAG: cell division protein SepF, partial [Firmicutes bacterium]|nr:cell division protein SepF [Bacillota bacterium]
ARDGGWEEEMTHRRRPSLVSLPGNNRNLRVVVMNPRDLEDGQAIADQVKGRRPVIVNLEQADERNSQRLLNFLSGVAYALDGGLRKVGEGIFLITPANVEVSAADPDGQDAWNRGGIK